MPTVMHACGYAGLQSTSRVMHAYGFGRLQLCTPTVMHAFGYACLRLCMPTIMHAYGIFASTVCMKGNQANFSNLRIQIYESPIFSFYGSQEISRDQKYI